MHCKQAAEVHSGQRTPYRTVEMANSPRMMGQRPSQKERPSCASLEARGTSPCMTGHMMTYTFMLQKQPEQMLQPGRGGMINK